MKKSNKGIIITLILGLPFFIFGMKELYQVNRFVTRGERADGVIVAMKKHQGVGGKYFPLVRFQTKDGKTINFTPGNGSNPPMYKLFDHVPVIYNNDYPNTAVINSFIEIWLAPVVYVGLGLLLLIFSGFQWARSEL